MRLQNRPDFASIDVSFISLTKVLLPVRELLSENGAGSMLNQAAVRSRKRKGWEKGRCQG